MNYTLDAATTAFADASREASLAREQELRLQREVEDGPTGFEARNALRVAKFRHAEAHGRLVRASAVLDKQRRVQQAFDHDDTLVVDASSFPDVVLARTLLRMHPSVRNRILRDLGLSEERSSSSEMDVVSNAIRHAHHRRQMPALSAAVLQAAEEG